MRQRPLIVVEWEDAVTYSSWRDEGKTANVKAVMCYTVGWKVEAPRGKVAVVASRNSSGDCSDETVVPRSSIRSIRRIE